MTDFSKQIHVQADAPSLRTLLQSWRVPKNYQGRFRQNRSATVNGVYHPLALPIAAGDLLTLKYSALAPAIVPIKGDLDIVYEDEELLIINKPSGLKTHQSAAGDTDSALNRVQAYLDGPVYITHRLDMATSGLLLFAKDPLTQAIVNRQLATKTMTRDYTAVVTGQVTGQGSIDAPIGHAPDDVRRRCIDPNGLPALTRYATINTSAATSRLALTLETGRTHQLRVHLQSIGHPIVGDPLYGVTPASRLLLHATTMSLERPFGKGHLNVHAPVPF